MDVEILLTILFFVSSAIFMWLRWVLTSDIEHRAPELWKKLGEPDGPREGSSKFVAFLLKGKFTTPPIPRDTRLYFHVLRWAFIGMIIPVILFASAVFFNLLN